MSNRRKHGIKMTAGVLQVYRIFKQTYGDEKANTIVTFIMDKKKEELDEMKNTFLTKDDKIDLINRISNVETRLTDRISDVEIKLTDRISNLQIRLDSHFKWLIGIMVTLLGIALTLHRLL